MKRYLIAFFLMTASCSYAAASNETHIKPFESFHTFDIQAEQYAENYGFAKAQQVVPEKKTISYENVKTEDVSPQDEEAEFCGVKWFNIGLGQFEHVSQLRELMNLAREYNSKGEFEKENEVAEAFCRILLAVDEEPELAAEEKQEDTEQR